jgi:hypothetical protein
MSGLFQEEKAAHSITASETEKRGLWSHSSGFQWGSDHSTELLQGEVVAGEGNKVFYFICLSVGLFILRHNLIVLSKLVSSFWAQVIILVQPPK